MLAFISDANILIDVEAGGLKAPMFSLGYQFAVPDVLYFEELAEHHAHWRSMGLIVQSLPAEGVSRVAFKAMQEQGRRLPWELVEKMLKTMKGRSER